MDEPRLETDRLVLRARGLQDLEACVAINSDPRVMTFLGTPWPQDRQRAHLAGQIARDWGDGLGYWGIFRREAPDDLLGWVGLVALDDGPEIQLAYRLKPAAWGAGVATEAAARVLDHALGALRLASVAAVVHPENRGSQRVMDKLGFRRDGEHGSPPQVLYRRTRESPC